MITDMDQGKAAEHLVVADLLLNGFQAYLSDQGLPYDVVLDVGGRLLKVQVKSTLKQRAVPQRALERPGYLFNHKRAGKGGVRQYIGNEFDLFAFVALDVRCIAYLPFANAPKASLILRPPGQEPAKHAQRMENIDQMPIRWALGQFAAMEEQEARHVPA